MRRRTEAELASPERAVRLAELQRHQPRVLRRTLRELADKHISVLTNVLEAQHPEEKLDGKLAELQLAAWQAAAKYGLGTNQNLTTGEDENQPLGGIVALPALAMERLQAGDQRPVRGYLKPLDPADEVANVASDTDEVSRNTGEYQAEPADDATSVAYGCTQCGVELLDARMQEQAAAGKPAFCSVPCALAYIG